MRDPIKIMNMLCIHLSRRGIGNTTAMIEGAKNVSSIILAHTQAESMMIAKSCGRKEKDNLCYGLEDAIEYGKLLGTDIPILIDHHALVVGIQEILHDYYRIKELFEKSQADALIKINK